jgi:hypothetical protein
VSIERNRFLELAAQYGPHRIANLIVLFSMSAPYRLAPHLRLGLPDPEAFRAMCHAATQTVEDARFDTHVHAWLYDHDRVVRRFAEHPDMAHPNSARFCDWLADGYTNRIEVFFARQIWLDALHWLRNSPQSAKGMDAPQLGLAFDVTQRFFATLEDDAYEDACDALYSEPGDDLDALQQTRFNVIFSEDDQDGDFFDDDPLLRLNEVREGNVLKEVLAPLRQDKGQTNALEAMVNAYLARTDLTPEIADYRGQTGALQVAGLYDWARDAAN